MADDELLERLSHIDFAKVQKKAIKVVFGFVFGYFFVTLASKFVEDNFSFRIPRISNKKEPDEITK